MTETETLLNDTYRNGKCELKRKCVLVYNSYVCFNVSM